ncbi:hypothetical protein ACEQ8H_008525 [Pleosporales sp. CAS-2024a]
MNETATFNQLWTLTKAVTTSFFGHVWTWMQNSASPWVYDTMSRLLDLSSNGALSGFYRQLTFPQKIDIVVFIVWFVYRWWDRENFQGLHN